MEEFKEAESNEMGGMVSRSWELGAVEHGMAMTTGSRGWDEETEIVHDEKQLILDGIYLCQDEAFQVGTWSALFRKLFPALV